jgi:hypothetical protein
VRGQRVRPSWRPVHGAPGANAAKAALTRHKLRGRAGWRLTDALFRRVCGPGTPTATQSAGASRFVLLHRRVLHVWAGSVPSGPSLPVPNPCTAEVLFRKI